MYTEIRGLPSQPSCDLAGVFFAVGGVLGPDVGDVLSNTRFGEYVSFNCRDNQISKQGC